MSEDPGPEMPFYQSHKQVQALEIAKVFDTFTDLILNFVDQRYANKKIDRSMVARSPTGENHE